MEFDEEVKELEVHSIDEPRILDLSEDDDIISQGTAHPVNTQEIDNMS